MNRFIASIISQIKSVFHFHSTSTDKKADSRHEPLKPGTQNTDSTAIDPPGIHVTDIHDLVPWLDDARAEELFRFSRPGDLVFAAMPLPVHILETIPVNHRLRPYAIVRKFENGVLAYPCYSGKTGLRSRKSFEIVPDDYNVSKKGRLILDKAVYVPGQYFINYIDHLSIHDQLKINMLLNSFRIPESVSPRYMVRRRLLYNSVVNKGMEYYFVFRRSGNRAQVLRMIRNKTNIQVMFNDMVWYLDCEIKTILLDDSYIPVGEIDNSVRHAIDEYYAEQREKEEAEQRCRYYGNEALPAAASHAMA